jgi:hypothetical protein
MDGGGGGIEYVKLLYVPVGGGKGERVCKVKLCTLCRQAEGMIQTKKPKARLF